MKTLVCHIITRHYLHVIEYGWIHTYASLTQRPQTMSYIDSKYTSS